MSLLGFPSTGKSVSGTSLPVNYNKQTLTHISAFLLQTLLSRCTKTASATAAYEYTTLTAIPGVLELQGANVQLLDLPGIIEGASQGRGRGRQVVSVVKTSDLIIMMLDCSKAKDQVRYFHAFSRTARECQSHQLRRFVHSGGSWRWSSKLSAFVSTRRHQTSSLRKR